MLSTHLIDLAGYAAAALVFLTFSMKTLMALRLVAIASNVAFLLYGYLVGLVPILILHGLLLPLNLYRAWEHRELLGRIKQALNSPPSIDFMLPHMKSQTVEDGEIVFKMGDMADRLFYVARGRLKIQEIDRFLEAGALVGEIGLFTEDRERTATVIAVEPTQLLWIGHDDVLTLCQKHPEFALVLMRLVAARLAENQSVLRKRLSEVEASR
ncbi:MAG: cyclic nucleotide-binding domain-containing protein [Pseudomonadota bacterium]